MRKKFSILILFMFVSIFSVKAQNMFQVNGVSSQHQKELLKVKILKVYPIPATTQINFQLVQDFNDQSYEIIIYNFLGKTIEKISGFRGNKSISLSEYNSGIYIYQLRDNHGRLVDSGKFNVIKQ